MWADHARALFTQIDAGFTDDWKRSRRSLGIDIEQWWLQTGAAGTRLNILVEAADVGAAVSGVFEPDGGFEAMFAEHLYEWLAPDDLHEDDAVTLESLFDSGQVLRPPGEHALIAWPIHSLERYRNLFFGLSGERLVLQNIVRGQRGIARERIWALSEGTHATSLMLVEGAAQETLNLHYQALRFNGSSVSDFQPLCAVPERLISYRHNSRQVNLHAAGI
jgi:hypothetical protein